MQAYTYTFIIKPMTGISLLLDSTIQCNCIVFIYVRKLMANG